MFRVIPILLLCLIMASCSSIDDLVEKGLYDQAIRKGIQKLSKTPNDVVIKKNVITAYELAQKKDLENLKSLREMEESATTLEMIYAVYTRMENRGFTLENANIKAPINSLVPHEEMLFAHEKMCARFADIAEEKMQKNTRLNYQGAYNTWNKVLQYKCKYTDLDSIMNVCLTKGKSLVVLQLDVQKGLALPEKTKNGLSSLSYTKNNKLGKWIEFANSYELDQNIDYTVVCTFNQISVSKNELKKTSTEVKKQVIDRYESRKNAEGKMQEYPVYVTAVAKLYKYTQHKTSTQGVYFEIIDNSKKSKIYQKQLVGTWSFSYQYTQAKGDLRALSKDQKKLLKTKKRAFPTNSYMVQQSGKKLKKVVESEVYRQRKLLQ